MIRSRGSLIKQESGILKYYEPALGIWWPLGRPLPAEYILNDEFLTPRVVGTVNATLADPMAGAYESTPNARIVVDTENKLSITGGKATFAGGKAVPANGDPAIWYPPITRVAGRMLVCKLMFYVDDRYGFFGLDTDTSGIIGSPAAFGRMNTGRKLSCYVSSGAPAVTWLPGEYSVALILRNTGNVAIVRNPSNTMYKLWWINSSDSTSTLYPTIQSYNDTFDVEYIRIPSQLWLPSPLISDGFSGTDGALLSSRPTDGLGHAEGVAGGIGSGGSGQTWLGDSGSIVAASGRAKIIPVQSAELVVNGSFDTDSGWIKQTGWTIDVADSNTAVCDGTNAACLYQNVLDGVTYIGKWLIGRYNVVANSGSVRLEMSDGGIEYGYKGTGSYVYTLRIPNSPSITNRPLLRSLSFNGSVDNVSVKSLTLSSLFSSIQTSTSNVLADIDIWMTAGTQCGMVLCLDSASNPQNFILAYHDGTNAKVDTCTAGVYTNRINAVATYVDGAKLRVITDTLADGSFTIDVYYNNAKVGSTYTAANGSAEATAFKANKLHGIFSTYEENTFNNFVVYPRGTEGQYSHLENF